VANVEAIAQDLCANKYRFLTDLQIGALRRKYNASRDEIRIAAILGDRLRRLEQSRANAEEFTRLTVSDPIELSAPVLLQAERKRRTRGVAT